MDWAEEIKQILKPPERCDFCGGRGRVPSAAIGLLAGTPDNKTDPCSKCFGTGLKLEK